MKYAEQKAKKMLDEMTLSEKIGQITQVFYSGNDIEKIIEYVKKFNIGSIILCGGAFAGNGGESAVNAKDLDVIQDVSLNETRLGIPILFGRDVIHGHQTVFPINLAMAASFNENLLFECYKDIREEALFDGIHWTYSPMVDFCHDPRWGRIIECQGEDPYLASKMTASIVKGFQTEDLSNKNTMIACAKHYIGYGASEGGRDYNHTEISDYALWNNYIPSFRSAINAGVGTVMNSFNEINGIPVAANRRVLTEILRDKLGFNGFVISDWGSIAQLKRHCFAEDNATAAKMALHAGIDMDMADNCYLENLEKSVKNGSVSVEEIDLAVLRVLTLKYKYGLFDNPKTNKIKYNIENHRLDAKKMCTQSMVLLKNNNHLLPLSQNSKLSVAGPYSKNILDLNGSWSLSDENIYSKTLVESLSDNFGEENVKFIDEKDYTCFEAFNSDIVVCAVGEPRGVTGEAHSLASIDFPSEQLEIVKSLKKLGKKIIGVCFFGRPIGLQEVEPYFDAILYAWHGGTMVAEAVSDVIVGKSEPTGRLPVTLPRTTGQIPIYYNALPGARNMNGYYGEEGHITLNYEDCSGTPMYPFGYGLSYCDFNMSDISVENDKLSLEDINNGEKFVFSIKIKNNSSISGTTVIQLYIHDKIASRVRPLKELKAYQKDTFEPFETKKLCFNIGKDSLGFYLEDGEYLIEKGEIDVFIGDNCLTDNYVTIQII